MPKAWTDKNEYKQLKGTLYHLTGSEFERAALPLVRLICPETIQVSARRELDRVGVDLFAWGDVAPYSLVVQCKGFRVNETEIASDQLKLCLSSIDAFRKSSVRARRYLLVYNRDARDEGFRLGLEAGLATLVGSGQVDSAEHWPLDRFLQSSFGAMFERVKAKAQARSISARQVLGNSSSHEVEPLDFVPVETHTIVADQYRMRTMTPPMTFVGDPVPLLIEPAARIKLLIGEAGFGKTTAVLRACEISARRAVYVPAAVFSARMNSTKDLLEQMVDMDVLLEDAGPDERSVWQQLARAAVEHLFKTDGESFLLILDALDESVFFLRHGGLQHLLNALRLLKTPVVLTTRTEDWNSRQADFASSFGIVTGHADKLRNQQIAVVRLLPWTETQMIAFARRFRETLAPDQAARIDTLVTLLESGGYARVYSDIPQRPLFLRWILETVAESGVHAVRRAGLLREFALMKIARDIQRPSLFGGERLPIAVGTSGLDATLDLAFAVMETAARCMAVVDNGELVLQPACTMTSVVTREPRLRDQGDAVGVFLNSLLLPANPKEALASLTVKFAHRAYQEYFLARYIVTHPTEYVGVTIPPAVMDWLPDVIDDAN